MEWILGIFIWIPGWCWLFIAAAFGFFAFMAFAYRRVGLAIVLALCILPSILGWYFSSTHFFVSPVERAIVIDKSTGKLDKGIRTPGIAERPLFNADTYTYSGEKNAAWCEFYTPSITGGYEVTIKICVYYDASAVRWDDEYLKSGKTNQSDIQAYWVQQLRNQFAKDIADVQGNGLTKERGINETKLTTTANELFITKGSKVSSVSIDNWKFSDPNVDAIFNNTASAEASKQQAIVEQEAAKEQGKVLLVRAQNQIEVLKALAAGQIDALHTLGITDQNTIAWFLIQRDLIQLMSTNPNQQIVVSVGGQPVVPQAGAVAPTVPPAQ